ncbi:MAG TPA: glucose-6-phosphate dehydrogenase [Acidimicrobiales bacterium]|nr:glucose-6-phosphate dehydrogenase [Acidimicrobiales bacterium]
MSDASAGGAGLTAQATQLRQAVLGQVVHDDRRPSPLALVIFGATGDLAGRKILPALAALAERGSLPERFSIVGAATSEYDDGSFRDRVLEVAPGGPSGRWQEYVEHFRYVRGDYADHATFERIANALAEVDTECGTAGNRVYYLATIPKLFGLVAAGLASEKCNEPAPGGDFARLVVEKPFGTDLASARQLDAELHEFFREEQIFRIDHYMGKETVQNVLALRFANSIFEPIWNRRYVDHVQITVAEQLGVEHRGAFYESAGALRDIVQNHVMQVLSLTLMEPPASMEAGGIRDEKVKLLRAVLIPDPGEEVNEIVRAQYVAGTIEGEAVPGYRDEEGVDPHSTTETYVATRLHVDNWRWADIPMYVRTGKRLAKRATEVSTVFQRPPHLPFAGALSRGLHADVLTLRIQPDEGISLSFGAKIPGPGFRVRSVSMNFSYNDVFPGQTVDAYERLLLDAMIGDPMLFIRTDEVEQAWMIVAPMQESFAEGEPPLARYAAGSWGPTEANRLIEASGRSWINPT